MDSSSACSTWWAGSPSGVVWMSGSGSQGPHVRLPSRPCGAQLVEAQAGDHRRQPGPKFVRFLLGPLQAQPALLDHVLGAAHLPEQPVGDGEQPRSLRLEPLRQPTAARCHTSASDDRARLFASTRAAVSAEASTASASSPRAPDPVPHHGQAIDIVHKRPRTTRETAIGRAGMVVGHRQCGKEPVIDQLIPPPGKRLVEGALHLCPVGVGPLGTQVADDVDHGCTRRRDACEVGVHVDIDRNVGAQNPDGSGWLPPEAQLPGGGLHGHGPLRPRCDHLSPRTAVTSCCQPPCRYHTPESDSHSWPTAASADCTTGL